MPEISIHPFIGNGVDDFDPDATKVDRTMDTITWLSIWFGQLEVTVFGSPEELLGFTRHLHELAMAAQDIKHEEILNDFDEEDRHLAVVDNGEEPPDDWPDTGLRRRDRYPRMEPDDPFPVRDHRVEEMGEDPFKYEHRSDP